MKQPLTLGYDGIEEFHSFPNKIKAERLLIRFSPTRRRLLWLLVTKNPTKFCHLCVLSPETLVSTPEFCSTNTSFPNFLCALENSGGIIEILTRILVNKQLIVIIKICRDHRSSTPYYLM